MGEGVSFFLLHPLRIQKDNTRRFIEKLPGELFYRDIFGRIQNGDMQVSGGRAFFQPAQAADYETFIEAGIQPPALEAGIGEQVAVYGKKSLSPSGLIDFVFHKNALCEEVRADAYDSSRIKQGDFSPLRKRCDLPTGGFV